ncbi:septum formation initiator family protein [Clostridium estertheticum]|uniref:Septum formation initiator family protein n=2 Tax=Clostridium estertheticum TaxID=238834 RepID=A0AA47EGY0_9CLOT|nr:septum formation initiator family protein [Clostridium estertheticum]
MERKRVYDMKKKFNIRGLVLIFVFVYVSYLFIQQQATMGRQKKELQKYNVELQKKKEEKKTLQDEVELSKTDKYIEKLAREILGLVKEGETPVMDNKN